MITPGATRRRISLLVGLLVELVGLLDVIWLKNVLDRRSSFFLRSGLLPVRTE